MKRGLLGLQFGDQFFGAVNRDLIAYRALYFPIPLNCLVDVYTPVAHKKSSAFARGVLICSHVYKTAKRVICSSSK
jgi:hypothetical protein